MNDDDLWGTVNVRGRRKQGSVNIIGVLLILCIPKAVRSGDFSVTSNIPSQFVMVVIQTNPKADLSHNVVPCTDTQSSRVPYLPVKGMLSPAPPF